MSLWVVLEGIWIRSETVNIAGYQMRLLVWRVVKKTLKFCLTFLILLTINFLLTATFQKTPLCCLWRIVESHHLAVKKLGFISLSQVTHLELLNFPFPFFSFFFFPIWALLYAHYHCVVKYKWGICGTFQTVFWGLVYFFWQSNSLESDSLCRLYDRQLRWLDWIF